jgi:hypothetical protein
MNLRMYRTLGPYAALAGIVLVAYWRVFHFPFIQDDWGWLYRFRTESPAALLTSIFTVKGVLFYRPLAELYLYVMYLAFGVNPIPFHAVALLLHFASACLVVSIVKLLTRDGVIAWAAGFIYALAIAIVFESLLWAVGIFDLGGAFFFLLSMYLFMKGRPIASAIVYLAGCLFKETVIVLPIILFAYTMITERPDRVSRSALVRTRLLPMAIALCMVAAVKLMGRHPFRLAISDPYAVRFVGPHVWILITKYVFCMFQSFYPYGAIKSASFKIILSCIALVLALSGWLVSRKPRDSSVARAFWFLLVWCSAALLPIIFLPNHAYRYYAIYALPAFIALALTQVRVLGSSLGLGRRYGRVVIVAIAAFAVVLSSGRVHRMLREGLEWNTLIEGSNNLIRKAALVEVVHDGLMKYLPKPPQGAVIVLGNVDVWAFNKDSGPRVWFSDTTISVYPIANLRADSTGTYIENVFQSQRQLFAGTAAERRPVDLAKLFGFMLEESRLRPVKFRGIPKSAANAEQ